MTEEELVTILDMPACLRLDIPMLFGLPMRPAIREQTMKALFDEAFAQIILPELNVVFIMAELTALACVWSRLVFEKLYMDAAEQGRRARPIRFITIRGANHMVSLMHITRETYSDFSRT
jgi:hypothetical protein